jgi:tRNA (Thr-GGU) A37 N-methylase
MHYGNAMQLEYEKRIQEAVKELEEALKVYPKYQDAIDKLDSIKSLYKLK